MLSISFPRTASWVADETEVTTKTTQKYLDQLVEDNVLRTIEQADQTLYCIDQLLETYREVATLQGNLTEKNSLTSSSQYRRRSRSEKPNTTSNPW